MTPRSLRLVVLGTIVAFHLVVAGPAGVRSGPQDVLHGAVLTSVQTGYMQMGLFPQAEYTLATLVRAGTIKSIIEQSRPREGWTWELGDMTSPTYANADGTELITFRQGHVLIEGGAEYVTADWLRMTKIVDEVWAEHWEAVVGPSLSADGAPLHFLRGAHLVNVSYMLEGATVERPSADRAVYEYRITSPYDSVIALAETELSPDKGWEWRRDASAKEGFAEVSSRGTTYKLILWSDSASSEGLPSTTVMLCKFATGSDYLYSWLANGQPPSPPRLHCAMGAR